MSKLKNNINDILEKLENSDSVLLIVVSIQPRVGETGLLEERGKWIEEILASALKISSEFQISRLLWTQVLFTIDKNIPNVIEQMQTALNELSKPNLESYCVIKVVKGGKTDVVKNLDIMTDALSSKKDFQECSEVGIRLLDGVLIDSL